MAQFVRHQRMSRKFTYRNFRMTTLPDRCPVRHAASFHRTVRGWRPGRPCTQRHLTRVATKTVAVAEVHADAPRSRMDPARQVGAVVHDVAVIGSGEPQGRAFADGLGTISPTIFPTKHPRCLHPADSRRPCANSQVVEFERNRRLWALCVAERNYPQIPWKGLWTTCPHPRQGVDPEANCRRGHEAGRLLRRYVPTPEPVRPRLRHESTDDRPPQRSTRSRRFGIGAPGQAIMRGGPAGPTHWSESRCPVCPP